MAQQKTYAAFFDLDGTLLNVNSGEVLVHMAYKNGLMNNKVLLEAFYFAFLYKFKFRETSKIIERMPHWLKGRSEEEIKKFTEMIFETILIQAIRPKMYTEIKMHREQNAKLVILSAAFNYICEPVAQHLQMDDFICSRLEVVDGVFTGKSVGTLCFDGEKLKRIKGYCTKHNFSLDDAYYYADSIADIPVLETVGNPHCINPDKNLKQLAILRKWHVHHW